MAIYFITQELDQVIVYQVICIFYRNHPIVIWFSSYLGNGKGQLTIFPNRIINNVIFPAARPDLSFITLAFVFVLNGKRCKIHMLVVNDDDFSGLPVATNTNH